MNTDYPPNGYRAFVTAMRGVPTHIIASTLGEILGESLYRKGRKALANRYMYTESFVSLTLLRERCEAKMIVYATKREQMSSARTDALAKINAMPRLPSENVKSVLTRIGVMK